MNNDSSAKIPMNGNDYIILGNEEYNKDFDLTDVDKLIMSESKGSLIDLNDSETKAIKYQISTYKGQSGSPIFMRIKRMTDKFSGEKTKKHVYIYQFVGLHSRRGPIVGEQKFYESEKMNILTENLMTNNDMGGVTSTITRTKGVSIKNKNKLNADDIKNGITDKLTITMEQENGPENESKTLTLSNEIIKQNGMCEYNIALSIMGETIKIVKQETVKIISPSSAKENTSNTPCGENGYIDFSDSKATDLLNNYNPTQNLKSEFILTKIYLNDQAKMSGLFKLNVPLSVLFSFGARIFNVPKEYILLKDMSESCSDIPSIQNYNFDHNKKLSEILEDPENVNKVSFELMLNIKKYGEFMSNNILLKFLENYDLEESQLKKDFEKKYMKALFHSIFAEINCFDNIHPTYGKLFKKIRKTILMKLGLSEAK